jgi:hypothetical protein
MTTQLYLQCFIVAILGSLLQSGLKIKSIQDKARKANVVFNPWSYFKDDWLSLSLSVLTIIMFLFFVEEFANFSEVVMQYLKFGFAFIGYTGSDIISRIFSVANKRINDAIDYKTTIADEATGTKDKPTPATKP